MAVFRQLGPVPVWPYFFLSVAAGALGMVFLAIWLPDDYPAESDLRKVSGEIESVAIRNEISNTGAGAMIPALSAVYYTLKGVRGEFRYPSTHPKYLLVSEYTGGALDVWVVGSEIGSGKPMTIWRILERNPLKPEIYEQTSITYDEIIARLVEANRSMVVAGYWLLAACGGFMLLGIGARKWNRGRSHHLADCRVTTSER